MNLLERNGVLLLLTSVAIICFGRRDAVTEDLNQSKDLLGVENAKDNVKFKDLILSLRGQLEAFKAKDNLTTKQLLGLIDELDLCRDPHSKLIEAVEGLQDFSDRKKDSTALSVGEALKICQISRSSNLVWRRTRSWLKYDELGQYATTKDRIDRLNFALQIKAIRSYEWVIQNDSWENLSPYYVRCVNSVSERVREAEEAMILGRSSDQKSAVALTQ